MLCRPASGCHDWMKERFEQATQACTDFICKVIDGICKILANCWTVLRGDVGISLAFLLFSAFTLMCAIGKLIQV